MTRKKRDEPTEKPFHKKDDFIKLQKKWYKKLDDSGFIDVERKRTSHQRPLNERTGELAGSNIYYYRQKALSLAASLHSLLGKFSYNATKLPKIYRFCDLNAYNYDKKLKKVTKLTKHDRIMLRLRSDAMSYENISKYLRRHCAKGSNASSHLGRSGTAFSVFYVHTRMQKLLKIMKLWQLYELNNDTAGTAELVALNSPQTGTTLATAKTVPADSGTVIAWGVSKTGQSDEA